MVSTIIIDRMRQHSSLNGQVQVLVINRHVSFFWTCRLLARTTGPSRGISAIRLPFTTMEDHKADLSVSLSVMCQILSHMWNYLLSSVWERQTQQMDSGQNGLQESHEEIDRFNLS